MGPQCGRDGSNPHIKKGKSIMEDSGGATAQMEEDPGWSAAPFPMLRSGSELPKAKLLRQPCRRSTVPTLA